MRVDARERARLLEKTGKADAAVQAYRELGLIDDAARVLGSLRRQKEAAELLVGSLNVDAAQVGQLDPAGKKRALMAAIFFSKAGENVRAVQLFMALGEQARAVEVLQRAGDGVGAARLQALKPGQFETASLVPSTRPRATAVGGHAVSLPGAQKLEAAGKLDLALESYVQLKRFAEAAACAFKLGRFDDAAQLHADAGQPFEAAECYAKAGDTGKELENLVRVQRTDPRYQAAAARAIRLSLELKAGVSFQLEHFLGTFAAGLPQTAEEHDTFYLLGCLYQQHDFAESAREAFEKVRGHKDAAARLAELTRGPSDSIARKVLESADLHLRGRGTLPSLDALPGLDLNMGTPYSFPPQAENMGTPYGFSPQGEASENGYGVPTLLPPQGEASENEYGVPTLVPLPEEDPFADGVTIAGRYLIEEKIGQGGMASVYRAHDLELDERVGLKVFGLENKSEMLVARFKQELKLSRQLQHPNIIRLYDIGLYEGHRYISMELLSGKSLKERMTQPIAFVDALGLLVQACSGLQAAHDAGVIHRDIKPDNLFVTDAGLLKVMDFGIAKQFAVSGVTVAGAIAGTPLYMSPEQIGSFSTVTHATDLYALGVCAYEMFTGAVPFAHPELVPLLMMHVNERPAALRSKNPSIPPDLEAVVLRLLEKDPLQRFASARECGVALEAIRSRYR